MAYENVVFYPVQSSNIAQIGYDELESVLYVTFHNGSTYWYSDVPMNIYEGFISAPSAGQYFWQNIRSIYPYERMI